MPRTESTTPITKILAVERTTTNLPVVEAVLEPSGRTVRVLCPFCRGPRGGQRVHVHGVRMSDGTLRYGPRVSHCYGSTTQTYVLVPAPDAAQ